MGSGKAILGGLLRGAGKGMVAQAEAKREAAMERLKEFRRQLEREDEQDFRRDLREGDRAHQSQLHAADREHRRGLLTRTQPDASGTLFGITAGGETRDLGIQVPGDKDAGGMSASDKRLWEVVYSKYTKEDLDGETTDWAAMARELRDQHNRPDLAKLAAPAAGSERIDVESPEYRKAEELADAWISEQAGFFSRDKSDFKDFKGNRESARQAKVMEFYEQLAGQRPTTVAGGNGSGTPPPSAAVAPPGSGTQSDPYRATQQSEIDWFRQHAPAGSVIKVNGKLYQK